MGQALEAERVPRLHLSRTLVRRPVTEPSSSTPRWATIVPVLLGILTTAAMLGSFMLTIGAWRATVDQQIKELDTRVAKGEVRADRADLETRENGKQLAAVNAKLDLLIARTPRNP